ncbi:protein translocase subunit SecF [Brachybacterium sp. J144]|uniref:protein translocase subunit SecF n=1 Tax=unclassified Brachybacterium TaxID=2623841 RepID=UPI002E78CD68|nr:MULTISPECIES: protein translocase subunit SecF [unclassified Brachybacterium]MEE1617641.1 protein translocase subunit SecF [Brachybacterium sp. J153]MEE1651342.1 protein translocase subunit SecF [Brachybacterium sp. J144]
MTAVLSRLGNDLHEGRRVVPIVRRRRTWYLISVIVLVVLGSLAGLRGPNLGIEFTGGSEFQVAGVADTEQTSAREVVREVLPDSEPKITVLGQNTLRVQTDQLDSTQTAELAADLADAYGVEVDAVSTSYIGPVWSGDITQKMLRSVVVFLALVAITMAVYFRNLKSSAAALIALVHDMLVTAAVYLVSGFEITPAAVIGFLTVMGYSLYDTIVVFDKVRENTSGLLQQTRHSFADQVERAANQTLVRSINTSVVALLPVGSILVIGAFLLGAGTLKDISLALFIGILAGTYSSVFLAPGLLVDLRRGESELRAHTARVERTRRSGTVVEAAPRVEDADDGLGREDVRDEEDDADEVEIAAAGGATGSTRGSRPAAPRTQPRRTTRRRRTSDRRGQR